MALLDLLGRRWVLRILWELRDNAKTFRALRADCDDVSPSVLNQRLRELRASGFVELSDEGYRLTRPGRDLFDSLQPLHRVAKAWSRRQTPQKNAPSGGTQLPTQRR